MRRDLRGLLPEALRLRIVLCSYDTPIAGTDEINKLCRQVRRHLRTNPPQRQPCRPPASPRSAASWGSASSAYSTLESPQPVKPIAIARQLPPFHQLIPHFLLHLPRQCDRL